MSRSIRCNDAIDSNYLIFYDVLPDAVHVLRVFHGARKLDELFP